MSKYIRKLFQKKRWRSTAPITKDVGVLDTCDGQSVRGWALGDEEPALLLITKNGDRICEFEANEFRSDLFGIGYGDCAFEKVVFDSLANDYLNKKEITLNVQFKGSLNSLNGSPVKFNPRNIKSKLWCENNIIEGWVEDFNNPNLIFEVSVEFNRNTVKKLMANKTRFGPGDGHGFSVDLETFGSIEKKYIKLSSKVMGCEFPLTISDKEHTNTLAGLEVLSRDTKQEDTYLAKVDRCWEVNSRPTVIIPVFGGVRETVACIRSVFITKNSEPFEVVVIDDRGPNDLIREEVCKLQSEYGFTFIQNEVNRGFVKTANIGMSLAIEAGNDVVLLNSDTVVTDHWLDNLKSACYQEQNIGTVTPMSNNASIFSYPKPSTYNDFPSDLREIPKLGRLFNQNSNEIYDVPTAHGFCMYIRHEALKSVGLFNEELWGLGYGEENDLSMRMVSHGWRNVMLANTFVYHHGSVSFCEQAENLMDANLKKLVDLYPDYLGLVREFDEQDPARLARNNISRKILLGNRKSTSILVVRHNFSGGTEKAIDALASELIKNNVGCYTLKVFDGKYWVLTDEEAGVELKLSWRTEYKDIVGFLKLLNLERIEFHNVLQFSPVVRSLPDALEIPYTVVIHDYYVICPRITLTSSSGRYCGEPETLACNRCIKNDGVYDSLYMDVSSFGGDIEEWRSHNAIWVERASMVVVPDIDVKDRLLKYFSLINIVVRPHENIELNSSGVGCQFNGERKSVSNQNEQVVIGVVGAIGFHKGLSNLLSLCDFINTLDSDDVKIKIVGSTEADMAFSAFNFVSITGPYQQSELQSYLSDVDVVLFPGEVPETYSFTLSEVLAKNKDIVAMDVGAIGSRLRHLSMGYLLPLPFDAHKVYRKICSICNRNFNSAPKPTADLLKINRNH